RCAQRLRRAGLARGTAHTVERDPDHVDQRLARCVPGGRRFPHHVLPVSSAVLALVVLAGLALAIFAGRWLAGGGGCSRASASGVAMPRRARSANCSPIWCAVKSPPVRNHRYTQFTEPRTLSEASLGFTSARISPACWPVSRRSTKTRR